MDKVTATSRKPMALNSNQWTDELITKQTQKNTENHLSWPYKSTTFAERAITINIIIKVADFLHTITSHASLVPIRWKIA
jgi:hypothetical protein